jgi:AraC-like DNA-binding protein
MLKLVACHHASMSSQCIPEAVPVRGAFTRPAVSLADFGSIVIASGARSWVAHIHREHQMNFHLGGGDALVRNGDDAYLLRAGEYNLHNPWVTHSVKVDPRRPCRLLTINISPRWLSSRRGVPVESLPLLWPLHNVMSIITSGLVDEVVARFERDGEFGAAVPWVHTLVDHIFDLHHSAPVPMAVRLDESGAARRIRGSLHYIENNAVGPIRIADVAAHACMSRSHFFREFQNQVGASPLRVIDAVRVSWAVEQLLRTDTPIAELGDQLGFSTPSHFGRFFAAHIGMSPSEYRGQPAGALRVDGLPFVPRVASIARVARG